jgi:carbon-monoxide dehydrogenase medium subunit
MKAPEFDYARPATLPEAIGLLAAHGGDAQPLAGGQSLMPMLNFRVAAPSLLVDLADLADLRGFDVRDGVVRIGAMTRYCELQAVPDLGMLLPLVARALPHIAHDAIRNRGTLGGSLALADPAAEMPAVMLALGATLELAGPEGRRRVAADDFFLGVYDTARQPDELLVAVHVPVSPPGARVGFCELAQRHGDYAMTGVAVAAGETDPLGHLRIAFFALADRPLRVPALEQALWGTDGTLNAAAEAALDALPCEGDLKASAALKRHYAGVVLRRALAEVHA